MTATGPCSSLLAPFWKHPIQSDDKVQDEKGLHVAVGLVATGRPDRFLAQRDEFVVGAGVDVGTALLRQIVSAWGPHASLWCSNTGESALYILRGYHSEEKAGTA